MAMLECFQTIDWPLSISIGIGMAMGLTVDRIVQALVRLLRKPVP